MCKRLCFIPKAVAVVCWLCLPSISSATQSTTSAISLGDVLKAESIKGWRECLKVQKPTSEEMDYSILLSTTPDRIVLVPMGPDFALTVQEMLFPNENDKVGRQIPQEKTLLGTYTFIYGSDLWWGYGMIWGRPSSPPAHFGLEVRVRLFLVDTASMRLVAFPESKQEGANTNNRDTKVEGIFQMLGQSLRNASPSLTTMLAKARDQIIRVGQVLDGQKGNTGDELRRRIALLQIEDSDARLRQRGATVLGAVFQTQDVNSVERLLDDKIDYVRQEAIKALGARLSDSATTKSLGTAIEPILRKAILNSDSYTRAEAVRCIGKIRDANEMVFLFATAKDSSDDVRAAVGWALGEVGDKKALEVLITMLEDKSAAVYQSAGKSLDKLSWKPSNISHRVMYLLAAGNKENELVAMGNEAVPVLIRELEIERARRSQAIEALGKIRSPEAVEPLLRVLAGPEASSRAFAAGALGEIKDVRATIPLIACLKDNDSSVQLAAAKALGELGDKSAVESLAKVLGDGSTSREFRSVVAEALNKIGYQPDDVKQRVAMLVATKDIETLLKIGEQAIDPLIAMLADTSEEQRITVSQVLGRFGNKAKGAVTPLVATLRSKSVKECSAAAEALALIGEPSAADEIEKVLALYDGKSDPKSLWMRYALARLDRQRNTQIRVLVDALASQDGDLAVVLLGRLELNSNETEPVLQLLVSTNPRVRIRAAQTLGHARGSDIATKLWNRLAEENDETVRQAIREAIRNSSPK